MIIMQIIEVDPETSAALKTFKSVEWPVADQEHYGDKIPDFIKRNHTLMVQEEDQIQGYISFFLVGGVGKIDSLIVGQKFRGRGIGKRLLEQAEQKMKSLGAHKVSLETGVDWEARKLYEKLGYKVRVLLPNDFGHKDFVLMDKDL